MPLIERLQREVKRQSDRVRGSLPNKYDDRAAELRDLLEETIRVLRFQERHGGLFLGAMPMPPGHTPIITGARYG